MEDDETNRDPIAVIGFGCRFPGARDRRAFRDSLFAGACAIRELPPHRFDQARYYDPEPGAYGKSYSRIGGIVEDGPFDAGAYGLPPGSAASPDRAHLWALEVARETFDHAGLSPESLRGSNTAVVLGHARGSMSSVDAAFATSAEELLLSIDDLPSLSKLPPSARASIRARALDRIRARYPRCLDPFTPGPTTSAVAGLVSRAFGLTGRHMVVDAACASSFAALAIASRALRNGSAEMVLAGGVSFSQQASVILFAQSRALSARGSFPFDARADGFISSDGIGMVLLERLSDALHRGHRIYGLLRGFGASCDGKGKGMWAPRKEGQVLAVERALAASGVEPDQIDYLEAHGTSTVLGDSTEIAALAEAFAAKRTAAAKIPVGSVKGNIGHTREAAGIAGLIKVLIALEAESLPPSIGCETPSPAIPWERVPFEVLREARSWPRTDRPRIAAVDSFGIGGLNYQVLIEEPPAAHPRAAAPIERRFEPAALVGLGALFPGGGTARELWRMLCEKGRSLGEAPPSRWSSSLYHDPDATDGFRTVSKLGSFLREYRPDWRRHRMPPAMVQSNDPLQFMLLDAASEALSDAGIELARADRSRIGVVIGSEFGSDFALALTLAIRVPELTEAVEEVLQESELSFAERRSALAELESRVRDRLPRINEDSSGSFSSSTLASRIAKTLDLGGPAFAIDASSASSLASLEVACEILAARECDVVLYGGGDRSLRVQRFEAYSRAGLLARTEGYAPFAPEAGGFHLGEGAGVSVLMRLPDAEARAARAEGHIYAVVRAVGSASDGELEEIAKPRPSGLELAMRRAQEAGGGAAGAIGYLEAHGAAVRAFDEVELAALRGAGTLQDRRTPLRLGSVKSNLGHAQGAAGVASILKTALALHHRWLPPTAASSRPRLGEGLQLPVEAGPFPHGTGGLQAGVTAIGAGGIYYHAILEGAARTEPRSLHTVVSEPVLLRAASRGGLVQAIDRFGGAGGGRGPVSLAVASGEGLEQRLSRARTLLASGSRIGCDSGSLSQGFALVEGPLERKLCFLFAGQGSQYTGMHREIAPLYPRAAEVLGAIDFVLERAGKSPISGLLWSGEESLSGVLATQLAILAGDLMMYEVARAHGLEPALVTGHSYGDYPALVAAGALALEDAILLTVARSEAIESSGIAGGMIALFAEASRVEELLRDLPGAAHPSNVNSRTQIAVSGELPALEELARRATRSGIEWRKLPVPAPFHCPLMRPALDRLAGAIREASFREPSIAFLSSVGARLLSHPEDLRRALLDQLTEPVDFVAQIESAYTAGFRRFLEVGPGSALSRMASSILEGRVAIVASLDHRKSSGPRAIEKALLAMRASESPDEIDAEPDWEELLARAAPALRLRARQILEQESGTPGTISFFDATEARRRSDSSSRTAPEDRPAASEPGPGGLTEIVRRHLLEKVIEHTGYPPDLIEFDQDMEADLGIDTVKQAQIFGSMRERFDLRTDDRLSLRDFQTLDHVLRYVVSQLQGQVPPEPPPAAPPPERPPAPPPPGPGAPIVRLSGAPFPMGLQQGRALAEPIRRILGAYEAFLGSAGARRPELQEALEHPDRFFDPAGLEEIEGLAEGTGLPFRHLLAYNLDSALFPEYGAGCVQLGLAQMGRTGVIHAFNEDSPLSLHLNGELRLVIQARSPEGKRGHILFSQPGRIGGVSGANEAGLLVTSSVLLDRSRPGGHLAGILHPILIRRMLEECGTPAEAASLARRAERGGAWSILLSHRAESKLTRFTYDGAAVLEEGEVLSHLASNHFEAGSGAPEHSLHRLERLRGLVESRRGEPLGIEEVRALLRDRFDLARGREVPHRTMNTLHRVDNVMSLVAEPASGTLYLAGGREETEWQEIRVSELLPSKIAVVDPQELPSAGPDARPVMTRYLLRVKHEPLAPIAAKYRPGRILLWGGGAMAECLASALRARGAAVEILGTEKASAPVEALVREEEPFPDLCLLSGKAPSILETYAAVQAWARSLPPSHPATLSAITALGGRLGSSNAGGSVPEGGAILGLLKALRLELPGLRVKAIDVEPGEKPEAAVSALLDELDSESSRLEVGLFRGARQVLELVPSPARIDPSLLSEIASRSFLLTGGARGITARIAIRLAELGVGSFHLLGRSELDPRVEEWRGLDEAGRERTREKELERIRRSRGKVSPLEWKRALEPIDKALEIDRTLRALRARGARAEYHRVDVSHREALEAVIAAIRKSDGPLEAIVHGAGVERSQAMISKPLSEVGETFAAKVSGARNLLALTASDPLRLFAAFSSVSGRFGGPGQTDYAMASDMLARLVGAFASERPSCHAFTIAWPAWDEAGMAVRGTVRERLVASGQKLMPAGEGCDHFVAELLSCHHELEVVLAEKLDRIDLDRLLPREEERARLEPIRSASRRLPLVDAVVDAGEDRILVECHLDAASDRFLLEHRMGRHPILPAVAGLELLLETASLVLAEGPITLDRVEIQTPLKLRERQQVVLQCKGRLTAEGWELVLQHDPVGKNGRIFETERTIVRGVARPAGPSGPTLAVPEDIERMRRVDFSYPETWSDEPRSRSIYHGPSLRGLQEVRVSQGDVHLATIEALPASALRPTRPLDWLVPAAALDCCLQACALVGRARVGLLALPQRFGRLALGRPPRAGETCRAALALLGRRKDEIRFDLSLQGEDGVLLFELQDYGARVVGGDER